MNEYTESVVADKDYTLVSFSYYKDSSGSSNCCKDPYSDSSAPHKECKTAYQDDQDVCKDSNDYVKDSVGSSI